MTHPLYQNALDAEHAWHDALVAEYGQRRAVELRYTAFGKIGGNWIKGVPETRQAAAIPAHIDDLHEVYQKASCAWFAIAADVRKARA